MDVSGIVGPQVQADGTTSRFYLGRAAEQIVGELHGRFYEQTFRGRTFSIGSSTTALSANTISLTATTTPIVGLWNPSTSGVNAVILQAGLQISVKTASTTAPGSIVWAASIGNAALTLGTLGFNRKSLTNSGGLCKGFPGGVALTGLTNNLVIFEGADLVGGLALTTALIPATAELPAYVAVQNFDGSLIIPPGGVLALLNTVSTATVSVASRLLWEEVAI